MESPRPARSELHLRSCTECRRRKQKCKPSSNPNGPCSNCAKRYPPVACVKGQLDQRLKPNRRPFKNAQYQVQVVVNNEQSLQSPRQFGGTIADINTANITPIDPNPQNAQLFYYYIQRLTPLISSLDNFDTPPLHYNTVLPLLMHSPLLPKIGILEAARVRELFQPPDLAESRRMIVLKGEIIQRINAFINEDINKTYQEAIQSVLHLARIEYCWGDSASVMAHLNGIKSILRLKDQGLRALRNPIITQLITLLDFEIACCYEQAPCIIQSEDVPTFAASCCPETFENPLYESGTPFSAVLEKFYLPFALTTILDDVRLLTLSITSLGSIKPDPDDPLKQQQDTITISSHALRIYQATIALPSIPLTLPLTPFTPRADLIHEILRTTVIIYTSAITSRLPFSTVVSPMLRQQVYSAALEFNLTNWKSIPGLLLWVLLIISPGSGNDALGRLLRTQEALAAMYIGLKDFSFAVECLRNHLAVQRWLAGGSNQG